MTLDEKLDSVEKGMTTIRESLEPHLQVASTPTFQHNGTNEPNESVLLLRKHATLVAEWDAIQEESDVLREELKEDKWLTVFRTVTDQADGMMSSLEKAVNRCQVSFCLLLSGVPYSTIVKEFIWQVHRRGGEYSQLSLSALHRDEKPLQLTLEVFISLLESYEAKKKYVHSCYLYTHGDRSQTCAGTTCQQPPKSWLS